RFPTESRQLTSMLAPATFRPRRRFSLFFVISPIRQPEVSVWTILRVAEASRMDTRPVRKSCDSNHVPRWMLPPGPKPSGCCPYSGFFGGGGVWTVGFQSQFGNFSPFAGLTQVA